MQWSRDRVCNGPFSHNFGDRRHKDGIMKIGVHLPQYGTVASPDAVRHAAIHAEALGYNDIWVSDHTIHPRAQRYPSPFLYDPLLILAWAGGVTERVGLGTSVLVVPTHHPLALANSLASLDALSAGRLIIGVGVGWSAAEYDALGLDFTTRGERLTEAIDLWRTVWRDDPATFHGKYTTFDDIRLLPKPVGQMPIWVGGASVVARRRGIERGDGVHLLGLTPDSTVTVVAELRRAATRSNLHYFTTNRVGPSDYWTIPDPRRTCCLRGSWRPTCSCGASPALHRRLDPLNGSLSRHYVVSGQCFGIAPLLHSLY